MIFMSCVLIILIQRLTTMTTCAIYPSVCVSVCDRVCKMYLAQPQYPARRHYDVDLNWTWWNGTLFGFISKNTKVFNCAPRCRECVCYVLTTSRSRVQLLGQLAIQMALDELSNERDSLLRAESRPVRLGCPRWAACAAAPTTDSHTYTTRTFQSMLALVCSVRTYKRRSFISNLTGRRGRTLLTCYRLRSRFYMLSNAADSAILPDFCV